MNFNMLTVKICIFDLSHDFSTSWLKYPNSDSVFIIYEFVISKCFLFHFQDILKERRKTGAFKDSQVDFIDYFLKKIDEEKDDPKTIYTGMRHCH